jgi:AGCS family alanine or glycine:cation symporter
MHKLNDFLAGIEIYLGGSLWFTLLLLGTGIFFTIYLNFPQIRFFKHAIKVVMGRYDKPDRKGDASHFQALTAALSGTVGTGNIAGVAFAIYLGGPAALFWMLVTAFLGMTTKFVEVTLSHKYRETDEDGFISGGPMYYMKNKLNMKWLAGFFAAMTICSSFGTGSLPQINSISNSLFSTFGFNKIATGAVLAILLGFVILGGIKRIVKVTDKLVPAMAILYVIGALAVLSYNYEHIIPAFFSVFSNVFTGTAATGGFLGAGFAYAFNRGVNRGLFSNEAGQGSAPIAHAAARTEEPVAEGMVAILGPFIDTIIICSLTGLVILSSGVWTEKIPNQFQTTDMTILADQYDDSQKEDRVKIANFLAEKETLALFSGDLNVVNGIIQNPISIVNSRSLAEEVRVYNSNDELYNGSVPIEKGKHINENDTYFYGNSLMHSAPLTAEAFTRSLFGDWGRWIVSLGLLLFAFSTAIAWAYYGDRSVTYLFGAKGVLPYRIIYCIGIFIASFADTTIIWTISGITIVLMTLPNLIGILLLRKDMKGSMDKYLDDFEKEYPGEI